MTWQCCCFLERNLFYRMIWISPFIYHLYDVWLTSIIEFNVFVQHSFKWNWNILKNLQSARRVIIWMALQYQMLRIFTTSNLFCIIMRTKQKTTKRLCDSSEYILTLCHAKCSMARDKCTIWLMNLKYNLFQVTSEWYIWHSTISSVSGMLCQ